MKMLSFVSSGWLPMILKTGKFLCCLLVLINWTSHGQSKVPQDEQMALRVLKTREPETMWNSDNSLKADFDCDGIMDYAFLGQRGDKYIVAVLKGPIKANPKYWLINFESGKQTQDSLCSTKAKISLEEREGIKNHSCKGINLHDDLCDSFHIYWDKRRKQFVWSRL